MKKLKYLFNIIHKSYSSSFRASSPSNANKISAYNEREGSTLALLTNCHNVSANNNHIKTNNNPIVNCVVRHKACQVTSLLLDGAL